MNQYKRSPNLDRTLFTYERQYPRKALTQVCGEVRGANNAYLLIDSPLATFFTNLYSSSSSPGA